MMICRLTKKKERWLGIRLEMKWGDMIKAMIKLMEIRIMMTQVKMENIKITILMIMKIKTVRILSTKSDNTKDL